MSEQNEQTEVKTDYWFPKALAPRIVANLKKQRFHTALEVKSYEDGDKAMIALAYQKYTGPEDHEAIRKLSRLIVIRYIQGAEDFAKSFVDATLPEYSVGHEGRSGYRVDQNNRTWPDGGPPRRHHSVVYLPMSAIKADAQAAVNAAYDGIQQFCNLNGLPYPQQKENS
jgi:hypothetical protein